MSYAELHCLSNFSFLRGASHPEELIMTAEALGYRALAITDECSVAGVVRAYTAHKEHGLDIKLIVGSEFKLGHDLKVVLLCPDRQAYAELCRLITLARRRCEKGAYQLFSEDLNEVQHCLMIWLPTGSADQDYLYGNWLSQHFQGRLWIGFERDLSAQEVSHSPSHKHYCNHLSVHFGLPVVVCGDVYMHSSTRQPLMDTLHAIRLNTTVREAGFELFGNREHALRPLRKLRKLFPKDWLDESCIIAERCQFDMSTLRYEYPEELVPPKMSAIRYLTKLVNEGFKRRFPTGTTLPIQATIRKELKLIEEQHYEYFFLTIYDIVQYAKKQGILYQGRGSAANSIVCYCLEITSVDPEQISVLFERFISKERDEPPDIDVDFEHERREEIFQYIYGKYGRERAAIAATVVSFRFKSALRSVGKALGISESRLDFYIKNVNRRDRALAWQDQLKSLGLDDASHTGKWLFELTETLIGFPRHLSQHVGGFIISAGPLYELVPVENAAMQARTVIQWDKDDLESLGLLKVDVLALGMLTAIRKSFQLIHKHHGRQLSIADITRMGDDPKVYQRLQKADTVGVFQIESRAQMSMLPRLRPASYYDLVIQIAIVRPGPIQGDMVHPYLRRRDGLEAVEYPSQAVKEVLSRTLGVPIFQEQVIQLAMVAAGFTGGEADRLRRAMASWKKNGELQQFKDKLVEGMRERGYDHDFAERIFQQICGFGEYGFPESHSASFAVLAYVSAWLKHYYPAAFYCGLLNSLPMGFYSPSQLIQDAKRHQLKFLPVDIQSSERDHILVEQTDSLAIRLGFRLVKGLSERAIERIIQHRQKRSFQSLADLSLCLHHRSDLEALASANALASISGHRFQTRWDLMAVEAPLALEENNAMSKAPQSNIQNNAGKDTQAIELPAPSALETLEEDYQSLGLSLNHHPIALMRSHGQLPKHTRASELIHCPHRSLISVVGVVTGKQSPGTAGGVTFFTLEDDTGNINVVVWRATARAQKQAYLAAQILHVKGFLEREGEVVHVIAGKLNDISHRLGQLKIASREFR